MLTERVGPRICWWRQNHFSGGHSVFLRLEAEVCPEGHVIFPPRDVCPRCASKDFYPQDQFHQPDQPVGEKNYSETS
jgi:hypothetical protein